MWGLWWGAFTLHRGGGSTVFVVDLEGCVEQRHLNRDLRGVGNKPGGCLGVEPSGGDSSSEAPSGVSLVCLRAVGGVNGRRGGCWGGL